MHEDVRLLAEGRTLSMLVAIIVRGEHLDIAMILDRRPLHMDGLFQDPLQLRLVVLHQEEALLDCSAVCITTRPRLHAKGERVASHAAS